MGEFLIGALEFLPVRIIAARRKEVDNVTLRCG